MGAEKNQEMEAYQQVPLIDIIYKDQSRVDSFIAQITTGALRSVKYKKSTSQGSNSSVGGSIPQFLNAGKTAIQSETKEKEETFDPHDYSVLNLLEQLDLPQLSKLPDKATGKLVHIRGQISFKNLKGMIEIFPLVLKNPEMFGTTKKEVAQVREIMNTALKILPFGLEIEILLDDGNCLLGYIKEEFLTINPYDLLRLYGSTFPGYWHFVGILDDDKRSYFKSINQLTKGVNQMSDQIRQSYFGGTSGWSLFPILIFRELDKYPASDDAQEKGQMSSVSIITNGSDEENVG